MTARDLRLSGLFEHSLLRFEPAAQVDDRQIRDGLLHLVKLDVVRSGKLPRVVVNQCHERRQVVR